MQRLTRIGVFSFAAVLGLIGFMSSILFLIFAPFLELPNPFDDPTMLGPLMVFLTPILSGGVSFFVGLINGVVINLALRLTGGIELQLSPINGI